MQNKQRFSLWHIHGTDACEGMDVFSGASEFSLMQFTAISSACKKAASRQPDIVIIEHNDRSGRSLRKACAELLSMQFRFRPAFFLLCEAYPDSAERLEWLRAGFDDFLINPFTLEEFKMKIRIYLEHKDLSQREFTLARNHEKTLEYLDRFKRSLKNTKNELFEERTCLNNALKQVNEMTRERKRLKIQIMETKKALHNNIQGFSGILSKLIQTRVEENKGHGQRVADIAVFIARQFEFDGKKLEDLKKAAFLHETGLLFVPEEILGKNIDQMNEYEHGLFIQFPVKGAEFLSNCPGFENCAAIIRHLNENSDGTGFPQGLKRRYIPLLSRILAGADVFDTLRGQPEVDNTERFLEKLELFSGTRLDPNIVAWLGKYAVLHMSSDSFKVKGVGIHQLEPGMTLGTALFTHTGTKLFSVNTLLTRDAIDNIRKYSREYPVDDIVYIRA